MQSISEPMTPMSQIQKTVALLTMGWILTALIAGQASGGCREQPIPTSFATGSVVGWDLSPNGMIVQYYSENGRLSDHVTLHRIVEQGFEVASEEELKASFGPLISVLRIESETAPPYFYVFLTNPLFYGSDPDVSGYAAHVWMDAEEDGLNGNEIAMAGGLQ